MTSILNRISAERISANGNPEPFSLETDFQGSLKQFPARFLMAHLHQKSFTGAVSLLIGEKRKKIWFYQGEIFKIQSNLVPELLGRMMLVRQWINEDELGQCLSIQRQLNRQNETTKPLGEIVAENLGIDIDEIESLIDQQFLNSFLQAFAWEAGEFQIAPFQIVDSPEIKIPYQQFVHSLSGLFDLNDRESSSMLHEFESWQPSDGQVELNRVPFWSVLAGCRRLGLSGLLCVRRSHKLFEIVLKHGIPLTFYEGTLSQPRQVICVRRASEDHERFFVDQLLQMFSFLSGSVYFKNLGDADSPSFDRPSIPLQFRDETAVTRSAATLDLMQGQWLLLRMLWSRLRMNLYFLYDKLKMKMRRLLRR